MNRKKTEMNMFGRFSSKLTLILFVQCNLIYFSPIVYAQTTTDSLQDQTRSVIAKAEKSVVSLVISTTPYPNQISSDTAIGKLGGYSSPANTDDDILDLSLPAHASNNQIGNGVILTADGLILTPYHLIDGATKIYVRTINGRGSYADIYAADSRSDLAVLKMLDPPAGLIPVLLPKLSFGKPLVSKGDFTVAISGLAADSPSASLGLITAVDRKVHVPVEQLFSQAPPVPLVSQPTLIQTDARTGRGLSGGGLFNLKGELIGLSTALAAIAGSDRSTGYAVPMDSLYRPIIEKLKEGKEVEYGFLGVTWQDARFGGGMGRFGMMRNPMPTVSRSSDGGIIIQGVTPHMPAEEAGLSMGDVLLAVNGFPLKDETDLQFRVGAALAGGETKLTVRRRDGKPEVLSIHLAKANNPLPWLASQRPDPVFGLRVDHMSVLLQDLVKNEMRPDQRGIHNLPKGVLISEVQKNSPAESLFNKSNQKFVITKVNDRLVTTPSEFYSATRGLNRFRFYYYAVSDQTRRLEAVLP